MIGAIIGDIVGSRFEFNNYRSKNFDLFVEGCSATDDSIMTLAVARAILSCEGDWDKLGTLAVKYMQEIGRKHPNCGFGGMFNQWIFSADPQPYNSFGNGAAMRVSPCGFIATTEDEAKLLSRKVTEVTHNHVEGLKGAEATTVAIFMAKSGATKKEIRERIKHDYYPLDFTLNGIRDNYQFNETCQETVPQAIVAFLESVTFEDCIRNAISVGGDSDTLAAIAGSIAEAYYGVPAALKREALIYLDDELRGIFREWERSLRDGKPNRKFNLITKYIGKLGDKTNSQDFYPDFYAFVQLNPEYDLEDYQTIFKKHGLKWTEESMKAADVNSLDEQTVLALILGVQRAENFAEGVFETFITEGYIEKWLVHLKTIDDKRKFELDRPALKQVKISLQPFRKGNTSELFLTEKQLIIKVGTQGVGSVTHHYELNTRPSSGAFSLSVMADCLDAEGWYDVALSQEIDFAINLYKLEAEYEDGKTAVHRGVFDRAHLPELQFLMFVETIRMLIRPFGFGGIVELSGFMFALKKGEVKYCGVEFTDGGEIYHYRTTDLYIEVGDKVIVPVGTNDYEKEAKVKTITFCRWDDTPYPLENTKEIICMVDDGDGEDFDMPYLLTDVIDDEEDEEDDDVEEGVVEHYADRDEHLSPDRQNDRDGQD